MEAIFSIYYSFFPNEIPQKFPSQKLFNTTIKHVFNYLNNIDCNSLSLTNKQLKVISSKEFIRTKLLFYFDYHIKINTPTQNTIFNTLMNFQVFEFKDPFYELQKPYIAMLISENKEDYAFALAVKYKGTIHEQSIVSSVLKALSDHGKIKTMLSFIVENFNRFEYLISIPKFFLSQEMVDSALCFAKYANSTFLFHGDKKINPYYEILQLIIDYYTKRDEIHSCMDVILLIENSRYRDQKLIELISVCLESNRLDYIGILADYLDDDVNKNYVEEALLRRTLEKYLTEHGIYKKFDKLLALENPKYCIQLPKKMILQCIEKNSLSFHEFKSYYCSRKIPEVTEIDIYKTIFEHYMAFNHVFLALRIPALLPFHHHVRIEQLHAILKKLTGSCDTDLEKVTNLSLARRVIESMEKGAIKNHFIEKYLPTS